MPVKLNQQGVITLLEDYEAKILELLNTGLVAMKFVLMAHWDKQTGEVESLNKGMVNKKKTAEKCPVLKKKYIDYLQECIRNSNSIYIFTFINNKKPALKLNEIVKYLDRSRVFIGHNKVARVALSKTADDEIEKGLHKLSKCLVGDQCGLLLTNSDKKDVLDIVDTFSSNVYQKPGYKIDGTVSLKAGQLVHVTNTMEPALRALGMPVKLNNGVITLLEDYELFKKGQVLNQSKVELLILLHMRIAPTFALRAYWDKGTGEVKTFNESEDDTKM